MPNIYTDIPAQELTEFLRLLLAPEDQPRNQASLRRWFPDQFTARIRYRFKTGTTRTYTEAAPFRAWDTPSPIGNRPGRGRVEGELAPISIKYILRELDLAEQNAMADAPAEFAEMIRGDVYDDVTNGIRAIQNRFELVCRDFFVNGSATVSERGVSQTIDPQRSASHETTVSVGWDVPATADPFADERSVLTVMKGEGFGASDLVAIMNETTWLAWLAIDGVREAYDSTRVLPYLNELQGAQVRAEQRLPPALVIDRTILPYGGSAEQLIPDYKVIYAPVAAPVGSTQWGQPVMASDPDLQIERDDRPGPLAYMTKDQGDPYGLTTHIQAIGVPVMEDPDSTYALDVKP